MKKNQQADLSSPFNRRDFIKGGSLSTLMVMMGGVALKAEDPPAPADAPVPEKYVGPPVNCAVIGCGVWGREILNTLARLPNAPVVAVCDTYEPFLKRGKDAAPKAEKYTDYQKVLDQKEIQAVFVATPSHQHREIAISALAAGKHVYCEAPLANSIDDARVIAKAAKGAFKQNFQAGLQMRSDPQRHFLLPFIRAGAMGKTIKARAQWHKKQSWRRASPNPEREQEINWRLRKDLSPGLIGEIGIHQVDVTGWFINARPLAVTGYGGIMHWNDGRDVADTVLAVFEFPGAVHFTYECSLATSFDADYEMFYGTDAAVMLRQNKAWMFKEVDSPLLGWEVYARKDTFYNETGIALVANATKLVAQGDKPVEDAPYTNTPLFYALEAFIANTGTIISGVEDFMTNFKAGDDALKEYLTGLSKDKLPAATYEDGYEATVISLKANEAVAKGQKITFAKEWFENLDVMQAIQISPRSGKRTQFLRMQGMSACRVINWTARYCLVGVLVFALQAPAQTLTRYEGQPGSKVRIDGTSTIHDWKVESQIIGGHWEVDSNFGTESAQKLAVGDKVPAKVEVLIPVRSLKSGKKAMDDVMHTAMKVQQHPRIEYRLLEMTLKEAPKAGGAAQFDTKGALTVSGVTNTISMPVTIERLPNQKLKVMGATSVKMTSFGIKPPAPALAAGFIKTGDDVKITFEWVTAPAAAPKEAAPKS